MQSPVIVTGQQDTAKLVFFLFAVGLGDGMQSRRYLSPVVESLSATILEVGRYVPVSP